MNCFWTSAASCIIGFRKDDPLGKKRLDDEVYSVLASTRVKGFPIGTGHFTT